MNGRADVPSPGGKPPAASRANASCCSKFTFDGTKPGVLAFAMLFAITWWRRLAASSASRASATTSSAMSVAPWLDRRTRGGNRTRRVVGTERR